MAFMDIGIQPNTIILYFINCYILKVLRLETSKQEGFRLKTKIGVQRERLLKKKLNFCYLICSQK